MNTNFKLYEKDEEFKASGEIQGLFLIFLSQGILKSYLTSSEIINLKLQLLLPQPQS
jgi:hypothetical protein